MKQVIADAFPLTWPSEQTRTMPNMRQPSRFKTSFAKGRDQLMSELRRLSATHIVLSTNIALKNDGMPYANFKAPDDPGVAVYFFYKEKQMVFACDHWKTAAENIYAIMLTIEALRGIERWGSGDMLEKAFNGFQALPAPEDVVTNVPHKMTWRELFEVPLEMTMKKMIQAFVTRKRNELMKIYHSDAGTDPSESKMSEINVAFEEAMYFCKEK